ncbi:hypothetical protein [Patulibacter medicamentivorans]|uniref:hypothetical protein n=1 Tax=Patulibacter medicamentivorans TaxID=1097667 RepID=UPI00058B3B67|nr:hypothetical protein [Patulibacter medicamentivorans]
MKAAVSTLYVGEEEFLVEDNGRGMAERVRRAVAEVEPALASKLAFDAEAGGVAIAAPDRDALHRVIELSIHAGLLDSETRERLHSAAGDVEDEEWDVEPEDFEAQDPDGHPWPMAPHGTTETGFVGSISPGCYAIDAQPAATSEDLVTYTQQMIADQPWADAVEVSALDWLTVLVHAPTIAQLDLVARLIGLPGVRTEDPEEFEALDALPASEPLPRSQPAWALHDAGDWLSIGGWAARGVLPGTTPSGDPGGTVRKLLDRLEAVDQRRSAQIDIHLLPNGETAIVADDPGDVTWALAALGLAATET